MLLSALILAILALLVYKYYFVQLHFWQNQDVPTPNLLKQFTNTLTNFTKKLSEVGFVRIVGDFDEFYRKYKKTDRFVGLYQFFTPSLFVLDPELIKDVMITNFKSFRDNGFGDFIDKNADPILGRNPFMLEGDEWKEKRNEIVPAFSPARIKAMYPLIENSCRQMTNWLRKNIKSGEPLDSREIAANFTTDVVSSCIFTNDSGVFSREKSEIRDMGAKMLGPNSRVFFQMTLFFVFPFLLRFVKAQFFGREITNYFAGLMKSATEYREKSGERQVDYLEHLIQLKNKKGISDMDMAAHGTTFFIDGLDTSSIAIAHTLLELSRNERVQTKLRKAIEEVAAKYDGNLDYDAISEITYLDQCFNEGLRIHPPGVMTQRACNEEVIFQAKNGRKLIIKRGMIINIPIWPLHHDPDHFHDPKEFIPERFDPETGGVKAFIDKGVFLPFGNGPRSCLGQRFAYAQSKACIAEVVRNFELRMNERTDYDAVIDPNRFVDIAFGDIWIDFKPL